MSDSCLHKDTWARSQPAELMAQALEPGWDHHTTMGRRMPALWHSQHLAAPAAGDQPHHQGCQAQQPFLVFRRHKNDKVSPHSCKSEWLQLQISNNPLHFKVQTLIAAWKGFSPRWRRDKSCGTNLRVKGTNPNQPDGCFPYSLFPTGLGHWWAVSNGWVVNHGTWTLLCSVPGSAVHLHSTISTSAQREL